MRVVLTAFLTCLMAFALPTFAETSDWELEEEGDYGLKIYTRDVKGSDLKEFRGEMELETSLTSIAALLLDGKAAPKWMHQCEEFKVVEQIDPRTAVIYFVNGAPWPVSDRDAVILSEMSQDPETLVVTVGVEIKDDVVEENDDYVRIPRMSGGWTFTPLENGKVKVEYQVHAEPGGSLPAWLANSVVVDTPYYTMLNMAKRVKKDKYQNATVDFISNPGTSEESAAEADAGA